MSENNKERYEDVAKAYARYRPSYSKEVVDIVTAFCDDNCIQRDTVVDVGCGSGQSTFHWAAHFNKCLGVDISHNQIQCARDELLQHTANNVEFQVGVGETLPLPDNSVDMLSFGTCWHLMNWDKVIPEIHRVLKKPGSVAIYANQLIHPVNPECYETYQHFSQTILVPQCQIPTAHCLGGYKDSPYPFPIAKRHDWTVGFTYSFEEFRGLIESYSAYSEHKKIRMRWRKCSKSLKRCYPKGRK